MTGSDYEQQNVHDVYEKIAQHFSNTRYKPWSRVESFLNALPAGSIGCDVGAGNGKYMRYPHLEFIGCDRSLELCKIAAKERCEGKSPDVLRCDGLSLPFRPVMDFAISIAVIHHFSIEERRIEAVRAVLDVLKPDGVALIYVWALEQAKSRRGWSEGADQDQMVPWKDNKDPSNVQYRYYHLYKKGELEQNVKAAGGEIIDSGYEKDNWWCVCRRS